MADVVDLTLSDDDDLQYLGSAALQRNGAATLQSVQHARRNVNPAASSILRNIHRHIERTPGHKSSEAHRHGISGHHRKYQPSPPMSLAPPNQNGERRLPTETAPLGAIAPVSEPAPVSVQIMIPRTRPLEFRYRPPQCTECIENGVNCDGMQPCAYCEEPGFDCKYPGREAILNSTSVVKKVEERHLGQLANLAPMESIQPPEIVPNFPDDVKKATLKCAMSTRNIGVPQITSSTPVDEVKLLKDVPINAWLPSTLAEMSIIIKTHQDNLNMHREYVLQAQLLQAKMRAQARATVPFPNGGEVKANPFKRYLQEKQTYDEKRTKTGETKLSIKAHHSKKKTFVTTSLPVSSLHVDEDVPILPKYKSIGRMGASFLSKNVHTLKYIPYFVDDESASADDNAENERNTELHERYRNKNFDENSFMTELRQQRRCLERVWYWSNEFRLLIHELQLTPTKLATWVRQSTRQPCATCDLTLEQIDILQSTGDLSSEEAQRCEWLSQAFLDLTSIPVWHFLHQNDGVPEKKVEMDDPHNFNDSRHKTKPALCSICFIHNCLTHGAYEDGDDEVNEGAVFISDPEEENNKRRPATIISESPQDGHLCGVFCLERASLGNHDLSNDFKAAIGLDRDRQLSGRYNAEFHLQTNLAQFKDDVCCGQLCFLELAARPSWLNGNGIYMTSYNQSDLQLTRSMIRLYQNHLRLPCMLAKITDTSCMEAFRRILHAHQNPPHVHSPLPERPLSPGAGTRKVSRVNAGYSTEKSHELDQRGTILPCQHDGPCLAEYGCACAKDKVHCERFCGCDFSCKRRFRGCRCKVDNPRGGFCFMDERCECYANNRECDPWVCLSCGVLEVLDPSNKYNPQIRQGRCQNCYIQLDLPAKTIQAPSEVQGWGLFAGEDLDKYAFIGEYKGEIISAGPWSESDRRGVAYHNGGLEYLFTINKEQEIDGSSFGNKTRFMNNSQLDKHINVASQKLIANSVQRIMFYAKRPIKAGEELLYNYNYPESVTKAFWERGDKVVGSGRDPKGLLMTPAKPRLSNRVARQAGAISASRRDEEGNPVRKKTNTNSAPLKNSKRKRAVEDENGVGADFTFANAKEWYVDDDSDEQVRSQLLSDLSKWQKVVPEKGGSRQIASIAQHMEEQETDEDGDYEHEDSEQESEPEVEATETEDEVLPVRKRKINRATDKRLGGDAQRRAAATRRANLARGIK